MATTPQTPSTNRTIPAHALGIFRVIFGLSTIIFFITTFTQQLELNGIIVTYLIVMIFLATMITIGAFTRIASLLIVLLIALERMIRGGTFMSDTIFFSDKSIAFIATILLLLTLSGADRYLSYAMHRKYGHAEEWEDVAIFPQQLLALTFTIAYLTIGLALLIDPILSDGMFLRGALIGPLGTTIAARSARALPEIVFDVAAPLLRIFAILFPFALWLLPIRTHLLIKLCATAAVLHLIASLATGVYWPLLLVTSYPLFFHPDDVHAFFEKKRSQKSS